MRKGIRMFMLFFIMFVFSGFRTHASEITSIFVLTENIEAPGEAQIEIVLPEEKCLDAVNMIFRMKEDQERILYYWLDKESIQYSEADGKNICTISLAENVLAGTYQLVEVELIDQEGQIFKEVPPLEMKIVLGCEDTDFAVPELLEITVDQKVEAGKSIKANIKVKEDSGIKSADLVYYNKDMETYLFLDSVDMSWDSETESYIFSYKIPKYQEAGRYDFDSICLTDKAAYENSITYWRDGSILTNVDNREVPASGCRYLTIDYENSENSASMLYMDLYQVVQNAKAKSTVIYRGGDSDGSLWILDYNSLRTAKERQLTFVLPDMLTDSEIIINASKLPGNLSAETYAGFMFSESSEDTYDIKIHMSHPEIPFTVKFKVDSLEKYKECAFQFSKENEHLFINHEGYLIMEFPKGIQSSEEWKQFQLIKTERQECNGEHEWGEDELIEKATTEKVGKTQEICKGCGEVRTKSVPKISTIELSTTKCIYNGSSKTPTVTVKDANGKILQKGTDYDLKYPSTRKSVGRYYVTVTFKGKYDGIVKKYFTIVPKAVTNLNAIRYRYGNQIRISWTKSTGATGYRIYRRKTTSSTYTYLTSTENTYYISSNLFQNTAYRFKVIPYYKNNGSRYYSTNAYATVLKYTCKKGSRLSQVSNVKAAKKGTAVKVSWKNVSYETGYQISRSTSKTGTNIVKTYRTTKGTSTTVSATKGKTYYYKVRAYRTVNKRNIYGPWSEPVKYTRK